MPWWVIAHEQEAEKDERWLPAFLFCSAQDSRSWMMLPTFGVRLPCLVNTLSDTPGYVSEVIGKLVRLTIRTNHPEKPMREEWILAGIGVLVAGRGGAVLWFSKEWKEESKLFALLSRSLGELRASGRIIRGKWFLLGSWLMA